MAFHNWTSIAAQILVAATFLSVPMLTLLAFRGWAKRLRQEQPRWRSGLGVTSIVAIFLSWVTFISFFLLDILRPDTQVRPDLWLSLVLLMLVTGICLALALNSPPRTQTLLAGLLMILLLWASVNV